MLERLARQGNVQVLGVSRDVKLEYAQEALRKAGAEYADVLDTDGTYTATLRELVPVDAVPSSVLVRNGRAIAVHVGPFRNWDELAAGVSKYSHR